MRVPLLVLTSASSVLVSCVLLIQPKDKAPGFRDHFQTIGGTTRFDVERFTGEWFTRACMGPCVPSVSFTQSLTGAVIESDARGSRAYLPDAPGILRATKGGDVLVVMWVDEGFRTAAVGLADGRRAAIIDRSSTGGADRITAAREILDFNGWDVSRLRGVAP